MSATAQQEVDSLDRVLTRLATTEETNLEKVGVEVMQPRLPDHTVLGDEPAKFALLCTWSPAHKPAREHDCRC